MKQSRTGSDAAASSGCSKFSRFAHVSRHSARGWRKSESGLMHRGKLRPVLTRMQEQADRTTTSRNGAPKSSAINGPRLSASLQLPQNGMSEPISTTNPGQMIGGVGYPADLWLSFWYVAHMVVRGVQPRGAAMWRPPHFYRCVAARRSLAHCGSTPSSRFESGNDPAVSGIVAFGFSAWSLNESHHRRFATRLPRPTTAISARRRSPASSLTRTG